MIRPFVIASIVALALSACATSGSGYRQGYNGGYYAAAGNGYGDYYYDRPQVVVDDYFGYGYPYSGFGYGFNYFPGSFGFGYYPWHGYGYPYGWYQPWPRHHHHNDNDHDADDQPGGWWTGNSHAWGVQMQAAALPGNGVLRQVRPDAGNYRYQRDSIRQPAPVHGGDAFHGERREPSVNRPHPHDAAQR